MENDTKCLCQDFYSPSLGLNWLLTSYKSIRRVKMTLKQNVDRFMKVGHTSKTSPMQELNQDVARQSGSWRQAIFNRVVTPNKNLSGKQCHENG
jgi:hypothetical protein